MLLVLDTDVIVSAMRSPTGASAELLRLIRQDRLLMGVSVALALEYEAVCLRAEHWRAAGLTQQDALIFVDAVVAMSMPIAVHYRWRPQLRDPSDEMVLEAAVNAKADALLTFNLRHFQPAALSFGLQVQRPGEFLRSLS
ncbi:MAG: putative toxin-antitoxin system toxin component, PIN family [Polaromonas sp.]|nr:putative toxin-antitoxin system toxin component, PIN family [Polaromonas sp.]